MTRRTAIGLGAALVSRNAWPQAAASRRGDPTPGPPAGAIPAPPPRRAPMLCVYSPNLAKIEYSQLGVIAQQIGYEGVDLSVMTGGHVNPQLANVDLVRAIESVRGPGLEVPLISTNITSIMDNTAYPVLAIAGHTQVHVYRTGYWQWGANPNVNARLGQVQNDFLNLILLGQRCGMMALIPNRAGFVGESIWETQSLLSELDPRWIGYSFDPSQAAAEGGVRGWEIALRLVLPRLKAVAVQDFVWTKAAGAWKMQMCPMGEGMVDWATFFRILAQNHYADPISIHYEYQAKDELMAMTKDLEFVQKQVGQNWR